MAGRMGAPLCAAALLTVAACQDGRGGLGLAARGSPAGIPVTFESIEGPPAPVRTAFASELASAATARAVDLVGVGAAARYRVRGYLSTEPTADGSAALVFVWDVFDPDKRRARRLTGSSPVRAAGADPWSGLDKEALARLAAKSMDEIADFLSATSREMAPAEDAPG